MKPSTRGNQFSREPNRSARQTAHRRRAMWGGAILALSVIGVWVVRSRTHQTAAPASGAPASRAQNNALSPSAPTTLDALIEERQQLDASVWSHEVEAQRFERPFTRLWDQLNQASDKWAVLRGFPLSRLRVRRPANSEQLAGDIRRMVLDGPFEECDNEGFLQWIDHFQGEGYRLMQTEWHHSRFQPAGEHPARSEVSFVLHLQRDRETRRRCIVRGTLAVEWTKASDGAKPPRIGAIELLDGELLVRDGPPAFRKVFTYSRRPTDYASAHPIILHDLNRDGRSEIIIGRWNRVYWNNGQGTFREGKLFDHFVPHWECGIVADLTNDGAADYMTVDKQGRCVLYRGTPRGQFPSPAIVCAETSMSYPSAVTAGDVDGDNDLDLFVAQYRLSYEDGQMPTPYYDANDGYPAMLLRNDGTGQFIDVTDESGLSARRNRRTYSSSFLDLDMDGDLDLMVVSDYAGLDLYRNDGHGNFANATGQMIDERHLFGMAHTVSDFDLDGRTDLYVIGMSSTTARRLDRLNLGRDDRPEMQSMRSVMGYGNRMYLGTADGFASPSFAANVARTGWSWGATAFDFDLDGDDDIYVANGFRTGRSTRDYCTRFWCHDLYTGNSRPSPVVESLFLQSLRAVDQQEISWNGYEHNALLMNLAGRDFVNVGFLMDVAAEYDARAVVSDDLDSDGRPDLLVAEYSFAERGFVLDLHVYQNVYPTTNHWVGVRLFGNAKAPALPGTTVIVRTADRVRRAQLVNGDSFLSQHADTLHFGLGKSEQIEEIQLRWPDGKVQRLHRPAIDQYHDLRQNRHVPVAGAKE